MNKADNKILQKLFMALRCEGCSSMALSEYLSLDISQLKILARMKNTRALRKHWSVQKMKRI